MMGRDRPGSAGIGRAYAREAVATVQTHSLAGNPADINGSSMSQRRFRPTLPSLRGALTVATLLSAGLLGLGCSPQPGSGNASAGGAGSATGEATTEQAPKDPDAGAGSSGSISSPFDGGLNPGSAGTLLAALKTKLDEPGPFEEPTRSANFDRAQLHSVVLHLPETLSEVESASLFGGAGGTTLSQLEGKLDELAADPLVSSVILRVPGLGWNSTQVEAVDRALRRMKAARAGAGPKILCHCESAGDLELAVLSACDRVALAPMGTMALGGAIAAPMHLKRLLDRLGIVADVIHIGDYKGAAEPLTRAAPSPELVETYKAIVTQRDAVVTAALVRGGIDAGDVNELWRKSMFVDQAAVDAKLADELATWPAYHAAAVGDGPWERVRIKESKEAGLLELQRFVGLLPPSRPTADHVAVVYAVGNVIDGVGRGPVGAREEIASGTLVPALAAMTRDDTVKAVVLRIDSGGGSALASEQIWTAVDELAKRKPVVVSMGSVAASGGYYIASPASRIVAESATLTGSIGVIGGKLVLTDALASVGVDTYVISNAPRAEMMTSVRKWNTEEREIIEGMMRETYERFLARVAAGRHKTRDEIHAIGQGRVWTGEKALELGLVDELGGLPEAVAAARSLAKLADDAPTEVYPGPITLRDLMASLESDGLGLLTQSSVLTRSGRSHLALFELIAAIEPSSGPRISATLLHHLTLLEQLSDSTVWLATFVEPI